jgi:hypothetical protein
MKSCRCLPLKSKQKITRTLMMISRRSLFLLTLAKVTHNLSAERLVKQWRSDYQRCRTRAETDYKAVESDYSSIVSSPTQRLARINTMISRRTRLKESGAPVLLTVTLFPRRSSRTRDPNNPPLKVEPLPSV